MRIRQTIVLPAAAALALAVGGAYAADDKRSRDYPNFNTMDRNNDGALTRTEAAANPKLVDQFAQVDSDSDGKLSRGEYLAIMGRQDLYSLRESLAEFINPDGRAPLAAGGDQASAGGTKGASQKQAGAQKHGDSMPARAASPQLVRSVQQALEKQGVDAGPIDGIWGPRTHAGLTKFQKQEGLEATGQLNARTLEALGIDGEPSASAGASGSGQHFQRADRDNDGFVSREEFNSAPLAGAQK